MKTSILLLPYIISLLFPNNKEIYMEAKPSRYEIVNIRESIYSQYINSLNIKKEYLIKTREIAEKLDVPYEWLVVIIYHESHYNPQAINKSTNAVGLIQFMPNTIKGLGYEWEDIYNMTVEQQLNVVYKYYSRFKNLDNSPYSLWIATFYPYAINKLNDDNYIIGSEKSMQYAKNVALHNSGFDLDKNGMITIKEYKLYHKKLLIK